MRLSYIIIQFTRITVSPYLSPPLNELLVSLQTIFQPFFQTPQSSDAIPVSALWQWAAYGGRHKRNINGVWSAWATLLFISHFPNMPLGRAGPSPDRWGLPVPELFRYSLHTSRAPPKPIVAGEAQYKRNLHDGWGAGVDVSKASIRCRIQRFLYARSEGRLTYAGTSTCLNILQRVTTKQMKSNPPICARLPVTFPQPSGDAADVQTIQKGNLILSELSDPVSSRQRWDYVCATS